MSRRVRVHQFIVTELTRPRSQSWRACDLFGVSHWVGVPEDTEFPYTVPRLQLFTRLYLDRARPTTFRVRLLWEDHPSGKAEEVGMFGPYSVPFGRAETVHDRSFNLHNIRLLGVGAHTVELLRERAATWPEDEWVPVARTYFYVER
jgi:hypothetical protein